MLMPAALNLSLMASFNALMVLTRRSMESTKQRSNRPSALSPKVDVCQDSCRVIYAVKSLIPGSSASVFVKVVVASTGSFFSSTDATRTSSGRVFMLPATPPGEESTLGLGAIKELPSLARDSSLTAPSPKVMGHHEG